jgi:monovalent cation/proton antiporter MnhG/PhaG subunit
VNAGTWPVFVLLLIAVACTCIGAVGLVISPGALNKLHFTALAGSVAIPLECIALIVEHGASQVTVKAILLGVLSILTNAVLTHATARAVRVSTKGDWRLQADERKVGMEG